MNTRPETVMQMLGLHYASAFAVCALLNETRDPMSYHSVCKAEEDAGNELEDWRKTLLACNEVMKGYGVTDLANVAYVNMGDTSFGTVIYDKKRELMLMESLNQWAALYG